jgi:hypothetical protein
MPLAALHPLLVPALGAALLACLSGPAARLSKPVALLAYPGAAYALYREGPDAAGTMWLALAAITAVLGFGRELWVYSKRRTQEALPGSGHFVGALVSWPLTLPPLFAQLLADAGVVPQRRPGKGEGG